MSITDELSDSSTEELFSNSHKEERMTPNICLEFESRRNPQIPKIFTTWWQVADKFRQCLISKNLQCSSIVEFLDALLTHIRKYGNTKIVSNKFTKSVCRYLFAAKYLASNVPLDKSYYDHIRKVLVLHCILELRLANCFDDESKLASDILLKITLLMQGSPVTTVADILLDIDVEMPKEIRTIRSYTIMKFVHRKYLSKDLIGGPVELDDTDFVKHLILFHLWYKAENITEKPNVLKMFLSTIKPSNWLRSNPLYSPYLHSYNHDEVDDYKKLMQQPFQQKALVMALRQTEMNTDWHEAFQKTLYLDLTLDNETIVKSEIELTLNLPDEVINVDDDDDDTLEINYLPILYERLSHMNYGGNKLIFRNTAPIDFVEINGSDSDVESTVEPPKCNSSITETYCPSNDTPAYERDSPDLYSFNSTSDVHPRSFSTVKTYSRKSERILVSKSSPKTNMERWICRERRKSLSLNQSLPMENTQTFTPILRSRSFTTTPLSKIKKVTFHDPPITHVFERWDYNAHPTNSIIITPSTSSISEESDLSNDYIVTGPQCNYPYLSTSTVRYTSPSSLSQTDDDNRPEISSKVKGSKSRKKRGHQRKTYSRTSIAHWMKRRKIGSNIETTSDNSIETVGTVPNPANSTRISNTETKKLQCVSSTEEHATLKNCVVRLKQCTTQPDPKTKRVSVDLVQLNDVGLKKMMQLSEDMTLKEMMEAKEQMQTKNLMNSDSAQDNLLVDVCDGSILPLALQESVAITSATDPKSLLTPIKKKSVNRKNESKSQKKKNKRVQNGQKVAVNTRSIKYLKGQVKGCFISLKNITDSVVHPTSNSSHNSPKLSKDPQKNSINEVDSICRLPTKSPQEYQFKRSFEKIQVNETSSILPTKEVTAQVTPLVTTTIERSPILSEPLISNDQSKQPSLFTVFNATPSSSQFIEVQLEASANTESDLINHSLNIASEVEVPQSTELPDQTFNPQSSTPEISNDETLANVNCIKKSSRKATNCSPDTTTSSTPQDSSMSDINSPCVEVIAAITNDAHVPNSISYIKVAKQLRMSDDYDNDIPSPVYSPYAGKRRNFTKQKSSISKIAKSHPSQSISTEYKGDSIVPIDLSKGNDTSNASLTTVVNGDTSNGNDDAVDSTQIVQIQTVSLDTGQIGDIIRDSSSLCDKSSAIAEIINYQTSKSLDDLPELTSVSRSKNTEANLRKPKINVKSNEQLYPS